MASTVRTTLLGAGFAAVLAGCAACGGTGSPASGQPSAQAPSTHASKKPEVNPAGDIPDNTVYVPYKSPSGLFTVTVPQGWSRTSQGGATVFSSHYNSIRVATEQRKHAPTVASTKANVVPKLRGATPGFGHSKVTSIHRDAGNVVLLTYQATSPQNKVTGKSTTLAVRRYEYWKGGHEAILTLSGAKGSDNVDPWRTVSNSLAWH